jgi:hypothetical protein
VRGRVRVRVRGRVRVRVRGRVRVRVRVTSVLAHLEGDGRAAHDEPREQLEIEAGGEILRITHEHVTGRGWGQC